MSDPQTRDPAPTSKASRGFVPSITLLIVVCPLAFLAAGVGAFLGECVAVAGWGTAALSLGAGVGAGSGLALFGAWVVIFVLRTLKPKMDPQAYAEKVASFLEDMKGRGVSPNTAAPPLFQLALLLGFQRPPPFFLGFWTNFLRTGGVMGAMCASACALSWWDHPNVSLTVMAIVAAIGFLVTVGLGAVAAAVSRKEARKHHLPSWDHYPSPPSLAVPDANQQNAMS